MASPTFATTLNCTDGRAQVIVYNWIRENIGVDHVDHIDEPAVESLLVHGQSEMINSLRERVGHSVSQCMSEMIAVIGHYNGNEQCNCEERHREQVHRAMHQVATWKIPAHILGLRVNEQWQVEVVDEMLV